jgi:hypothetical protein
MQQFILRIIHAIIIMAIVAVSNGTANWIFSLDWNWAVYWAGCFLMVASNLKVVPESN